MTEQLTLVALTFIGVLPIILFFREKKASPKRQIGLSTLYHIGYVVLVFLPLIYTSLSIPDSTMNWTGKLLAIAFSAIFYFKIRDDFDGRDFILTSPSKGSMRKVMIVGVITIIAMSSLTIFFSQSKELSIEKLAYQLTMPGLDEELWRGILLGLLIIVLKEGKFKFGHPAVWITTIIFALNHSLYFEDWQLRFALDAFIITGILGYILGWMIIYSRSILPALIFHNLINFSTNFVEMVVL